MKPWRQDQAQDAAQDDDEEEGAGSGPKATTMLHADDPERQGGAEDVVGIDDSQITSPQETGVQLWSWEALQEPPQDLQSHLGIGVPS